jgi:BirA family biotin operon repressor/biotin-[acetyl-CoA-carboxylase] ligase
VSPRPLDGRRIAWLVRDVALVTRLEVREEVGSTNDLARELGRRGAPSGSVVIAGHQTAGRGRMGRAWHSPAGLGLYLSVLLRPRGDAAGLPRFTLLAGIAACEACRETAGVEATIEWPNDVVWQASKLGGVLAEARGSPSGLELVLGTGLNVAHGTGDFPPEFAGRATSLALARGGAPPDREVLAAAYLTRLAALGEAAWEEIAGRFERLAPGARGGRVRVTPPASPPWTGSTAGLAPDGALRVRRDDGRMMDVRMVETVQPLG